MIMNFLKKVPAGMMIVPLLIGAILNTFCSSVLQVGSLTTATFSNAGAATAMGIQLVCLGTTLRFNEIGSVFKRGGVLLISKFVAGAVIGIVVGKVFGTNGFLGLSALAIICAVTNSNGSVYLSLMQSYGDEVDCGAMALLSLNDGPFFTLVAMGASGLANIPILSILAAITPIIVGMILGNLDKSFSDFLAPAGPILIPFVGLTLGAGIDLSAVIKGGPSGVLLGFMTTFISGAFIVLGVIVVILFVGPLITGQDYQLIDASIKNQGPSSAHWFGTDDMGRDLFTRVCVGGRISIYIGLCCTLVMFVIGALLGALAGLKGGLVDDIIMRICEFIGNLPYLIIVVILSMVLGRSMFSLVFAMSLTAWVGTARMVRGQILQIKEQDYVQAATALGASTGRIIVKHLLPNTLGIIMVDITMSVPGFIFSEAFLSYIGLGVRPPETSWGALASAGQQQLMFYPHELFFPCLMIVLTMLTFHLIGDGLSDALDPKLRK